MTDARRPEDIQSEAIRLLTHIEETNGPHDTLAAKSSAMRIATDLMVCLGVGLFLGYWLDQWLATNPWGILFGIGFGMAAGVRSAIRSAEAIEKSEETHT